MTTTMTDPAITYSLDNYNAYPSGTGVSLYLDPEARRVYSFASVGGNSWPMSAHNGQHCCIGSVPHTAVAESVEAWLTHRERQLVALCASYLGTENQMGRWDKEAAGRLCVELQKELSDAVAYDGIDRYWDADDWVCADERASIDCALEHATLDDAAETMVSDAAPTYRLDADPVAASLRELLEREVSTLDDDDDHATIAKIRALLAT